MFYMLSDFAQASANCQSNSMPLRGNQKGWEFQCPACNWTQRKQYKKNKRTAYLVYSEYQKRWFANCHRCDDLEMPLTKFIKSYTPYFKHYQNFLFEKGKTGKGFDVPHPDWVFKMQKDAERLKTLTDKKPNTITKWTL